MNIKKIIILFLYVFSSACAEHVAQNDKSEHTEGGDVGNGGFVIIQNNSYSFYDYFVSSKKLTTKGLFEQLPSEADSHSLATSTLENIATINSDFSQKLITEVNCFYRQLTKTYAQSILRDNNSPRWMHPTKHPLPPQYNCKNCELTLAVHFFPKQKHMSSYFYEKHEPIDVNDLMFLQLKKQNAGSTCENSGVYFIRSEIVNKLDSKNLAALSIHEALWSYLSKNNYNLKTSTNILPLTAFLYRLPDTTQLNTAELASIDQELKRIMSSYDTK